MRMRASAGNIRHFNFFGFPRLGKFRSSNRNREKFLTPIERIAVISGAPRGMNIALSQLTTGCNDGEGF
jgi:hypothetical protein